jgi:arabinogalactan endo-1,4-beta-galactosidase
MRASAIPLSLVTGIAASASFLAACGDEPIALGVFGAGSTDAGGSGADGAIAAGGGDGPAATPDAALGGDIGAAPAPGQDGAAPALPPFLIGADISSVQQAVAGGATFVDDDGTERDLLSLLVRHGFNAVRLRTFVAPTQTAPDPQGGTFAPYSTQGYCDLAHTVTVAQAVKAAGLGFLLDFHYSDTWADPTKQVKPAAWAADDLPSMATSLHDYTKNAVAQLVAAGARPDLVQVGNGVTQGIELSPGTALGPVSDWSALASLLKAGIAAVHEVDPSIRILMHLDRCDDAAGSASWITSAMSQGVDFDVFGESCYTATQGSPTAWQTTYAALAAQFPALQFAIAEYNADSADPSEIRKANDVVFGLPDHRGLGAFFWEPTESGSWGPGLFTVTGTRYRVIAASIDSFDQMKVAYGL